MKKQLTKEESKELLGGTSVNSIIGLSVAKVNNNTTCTCSCLYANTGYVLQNKNSATGCSCQCR